MTSTAAGISIAISPLSQNADSSIRDNCETLSNMTDRSEIQEEKQARPITSTEPGMRIDLSPFRNVVRLETE
jgi:hypothetical protein